MAVAYFLAGDSYPKDRHVEEALADRLGRAGVTFVSQPEFNALAGGEQRIHSISERLDQLERVLGRTSHDPPPFLIGRSSGCVAATLAASRLRLSGVICLAYPFRQPGHAPEPARFAHLAGLLTPTLILQGDTDQYGGLEARDHYALSPLVTLRFVTGRHRLELTGHGWDEAAQRVLQFMAGCRAPASALPAARA